MSDLLFLEQTLHGYSDGHQLLAHSADLSAEERSLLLIMSDLSGPAFRTGYETYLTGYPLPGSSFYCVARTWFAPELPRPGCVWTQTLLIRAEDLARITNFDHLNDLYRRPMELDDFSWYQQRVVMDLALAPVPRPIPESRAVLRGLYGTEKRVVVPSENAAEFEPLALAIFEQQWPRLRRGFRFCTGALSLRDTEFDLSVSPPEVTHAVSETGLVIPEKAFKAPEPEDEWLEIASRDLAKRQGRTEFREFLWRFGPDNPDGRSAFRPLTEVFSVLVSDSDGFRGEKLLSATNYFYPTGNAAIRLKTELFGKDGRFGNRVGSEEDLLRLIVTHPNASSLPASAMQLFTRSSAFADVNSAAATDIALIASELGGENAEQYLEGYFSRDTWPDSLLSELPAVLLLRVIARHRDLVARNVIWARPDNVSLATRLLPLLSLDNTLLGGTLHAMALAGSWDALMFVLRNVGERAITVVFELIDAEEGTAISFPDGVFTELAEHNEIWSGLAEGGRIGPRSLRALSSELDPRSWHVRRLGVALWSRLLVTPAKFGNAARELRSWVFCLALGLGSDTAEASLLVRASFGAVYEAGSRNMLQGRLWEELEPNLTWYSPSWDKCARLVRSVAKAFHERAWSQQDLLDTFSSGDLLERALGEIDNMYRGYRYIRRLREEVDGGRLRVSSGQREALFARR